MKVARFELVHPISPLGEKHVDLALRPHLSAEVVDGFLYVTNSREEAAAPRFCVPLANVSYLMPAPPEAAKVAKK